MNSLHDYLIEARQKFGNRPYITEKQEGAWSSNTFQQIIDSAQDFASMLYEHNLQGKKIAIYAPNSCGWLIADFAVISYTGVSVPLDTKWKYDDVSNALTFTEASALIYSERQKDIIPRLKRKHPDILFISIEKALEIKIKKKKLIPREPNDVCKILFSSGTTGKPKAITLTADNMLSGWQDLSDRIGTAGNAVFVDGVAYVILPFHHIFCFVVILLWNLFAGVNFYLCSSTDKISDELRESKPTILYGVPLIWERIHAKIPSRSLKILRFLLPITDFLMILRIDVRKKLYGKIHEALGGRAIILMNGGAALDPKLRKFYRSVGLPILCGYGLTEAAPIVSADFVGDGDLTAQGKIFSITKVKILEPDKDGRGEIAIKGKSVTACYYKNPVLNKEAFTPDGYLKTGDIGSIGKDNYLFVHGRKKRMILTSNGENVRPEELERELQKHKVIRSATVYQVENQIKARIESSSSRTDIGKIIESINKKQPKYKVIDAFEITNDDERLK